MESEEMVERHTVVNGGQWSVKKTQIENYYWCLSHDRLLPDTGRGPYFVKMLNFMYNALNITSWMDAHKNTNCALEATKGDGNLSPLWGSACSMAIDWQRLTADGWAHTSTPSAPSSLPVWIIKTPVVSLLGLLYQKYPRHALSCPAPLLALIHLPRGCMPCMPMSTLRPPPAIRLISASCG